MFLSFLNNICDWWWLMWLLPAILGYLLGHVMMLKWKRRTEALEAEVKDLKSKIAGLEEDLDACRKRGDELESQLERERKAHADLQRRFSSLQGKYNDLQTEHTILKTKQDKLEIQKKEIVDKTPPIIPKSTPPPIQAAAGIVAGTAGEGKWAKLKTDNLQIIEGIGPKMNEVLNENGITTWDVLAAAPLDKLKGILNKYGDKYKIIDPTDWARQAKFAADRNWEGLMKYQSDDGSPSKARNLLIKLGIIKADT